MKYKRIINLNTPEIPCPGSHYFTTTKLCRGFEQNGLDFIEIKNLQDIEQYNDSENIVLLSDHFIINHNERYVYEMGERLKNNTFLSWHFNMHPHLVSNMPFKKYIFTGEYYRDVPKSSQYHLNAYNVSINSDKWVPFIFSSSLHPDQVGTFNRNDIYDSMFIGAPYKQHWIASLNNYFNYTSDSNARFLSEEERINVFLSSRVCLGFHNDANILNSCVTERVFEGMAYGCAVVSDNKAAEIATNGIVKYVDSLESVVNYIELYKNNKELFENTQRDGYEYIKKQGTYYHLAQNFMNKITELYEE